MNPHGAPTHVYFVNSSRLRSELEHRIESVWKSSTISAGAKRLLYVQGSVRKTLSCS